MVALNNNFKSRNYMLNSFIFILFFFVKKGRQLSAIILPENKLVQVDALKVYEEVKLE